MEILVGLPGDVLADEARLLIAFQGLTKKRQPLAIKLLETLQ